jgi:plasmid stabilization system protein ParE
MKVIYSPLAARELIAEARKYERKAEGLGELFIAEVEEASEQIADFPESGVAVQYPVRRLLLKRFPFSILYTVGVDVVRILALMHQSRGPEFVARRLKREGVE